MISPVTKPVRGEARKATTRATSSARPMRPAGISAFSAYGKLVVMAEAIAGKSRPRGTKSDRDGS